MIKLKIEDIKKKFNQLQKRQRTLILFLVAAVLFSVYYNVIYKQQSSALRRARVELEGINNSLVKLKGQLPDIEKARDFLNGEKKSLDFLKGQLANLEAKLPRYGRIPQLLGDIVSLAGGYSVDFISIMPKTSKEKKEYAELLIEMKFLSNYSDFVNYLNRLESLSQFLNAADIAIEETKDGFRGQLAIALNFATLLGEEEPLKIEELKPLEVMPLAVERSPFASKFKPEKEVYKKEELLLSGVIATGKQPTVIINNEVYKMGDVVGNKRVKQILPNMVILSDGKESTVLTLENK